MPNDELTLPPGAEVLEERTPVEPDPESDLELAMQLARLGASDVLIEIVGGRPRCRRPTGLATSRRILRSTAAGNG